jgi:hypothetical protein
MALLDFDQPARAHPREEKIGLAAGFAACINQARLSGIKTESLRRDTTDRVQRKIDVARIGHAKGWVQKHGLERAVDVAAPDLRGIGHAHVGCDSNPERRDASHDECHCADSPV